MKIVFKYHNNLGQLPEKFSGFHGAVIQCSRVTLPHDAPRSSPMYIGKLN